MIHVYPTKPRGWLMRHVMWLPVLVQTWMLHPGNGLRYAAEWASASLRPPSGIAAPGGKPAGQGVS